MSSTVVLCTPNGLLAEGYGFNIWMVKALYLYFATNLCQKDLSFGTILITATREETHLL